MPFTPEPDSAVSRSSETQPAPPDSPLRRNPQRPKKPPPITPRRFRKFFTPRQLNGARTVRTSRKALRDISAPVLNRRANTHSQVQSKDNPELFMLLTTNEQPRGRKRKLSFTCVENSLPSTPLRSPGFFPPSSQEIPEEHGRGGAVCTSSPLKAMVQASSIVEIDEECETEVEEDDDEELPVERPPVPAVKQYRRTNTSTSFLSSRLSGRRPRKEPLKSNLWQDETANFFSLPSDVQSSTSLLGHHVTLPFCASSCHTNSLTAIGDEEGGIRLLDSASGDKYGFKKSYLCFKPHHNAVMDLTFSDDDSLLATAAGDQTSHIIDMQTQQTIYCLSGHTSSLKGVRFQPGSSNKVLATCSRDGNINIWDLRCHAADGPAQHLRSSARAHENSTEDSSSTMRDGSGVPSKTFVRLTNQIQSAHSAAYAQYRNASVYAIENARERGRYSDSSVTSLAFIPDPSRGHLFVTGSEADATIKVWDMRTTYNTRRPRPHPVSTTAEPTSHRHHRRFGLTSLAFSTDGSKLYSLCRDHTVYAYSTSHLILGDSSELTSSSSRPRRTGGPERPGLGPIYAFRHPSLRISTFYPKLAVRKPTENNPELLAVGSSENCAVLFPTSEHYLTPSTLRSNPCSEGPQRPYSNITSACCPNMLSRTSSALSLSQADSHSLPIYEHGTPLIRGHNKEVTAVTWNVDGSLTTVSDDFSARCWREDAAQARGLRQGGETEGRRWMCGWAGVSGEDYDE